MLYNFPRIKTLAVLAVAFLSAFPLSQQGLEYWATPLVRIFATDK